MSRLDGLDKLMNSDIGKVTHNVADLAQAEEKPQKDPAEKASDEKHSPAQKRQPRKTVQRDTIRMGVTFSHDSEIKAALLQARNTVPPALRSSINLGSIFRKTLEANDAQIAKMIRDKLKK